MTGDFTTDLPNVQLLINRVAGFMIPIRAVFEPDANKEAWRVWLG